MRVYIAIAVSFFFLNLEFNTFRTTVRVCSHALNWIELLGGSREWGRERANKRKKRKIEPCSLEKEGLSVGEMPFGLGTVKTCKCAQSDELW